MSKALKERIGLMPDYEYFAVPEQFNSGISSAQHAKAYFGWFLECVPARLEHFQSYFYSTGGTSGCLNFSPSSLEQIGAWFDNEVAIRKIGGSEAATRISELPEWILPFTDSFTLTDKTFSVSADLGIYFGELLVKVHPELRWDVVLKPKRDADLYQPVILPFPGGAHVNPIRIAVNLAFGSAKGTAARKRLPQVFEYWESSLP